MPLTTSTAPAALEPHPGVRFRYDWTTRGTLRLAITLSVFIAVPAFILGFAGAYLDKLLNTGGMFMFFGLFGAMVISGSLIWDYVHKYVAWLSKQQALKNSSTAS